MNKERQAVLDAAEGLKQQVGACQRERDQAVERAALLEETYEKEKVIARILQRVGQLANNRDL